MGKTVNSNRKLVGNLNDLCFGMHGHLSSLLKNLHYFFNLKKRKNEVISKVYLQCIVSELKHIIMLFNLIEELGGYPRIYNYKSNQVDYYKIKENRSILESVAILDSIANQKLLIKQYLKIKEQNYDKKVNVVIDKILEEISEELDFFSENLVNKKVNGVNN